MSLCHDLADRIVNCKIDNSDHKIIEASNSAILDTIGVTLIGSKSEATRSVLKALDAKNLSDGVLIYGKKLRLSPLGCSNDQWYVVACA